MEVLFLENSSEGGASFVLSLPLGTVETEDVSDELTETDAVDVGEEVTSVSEFANRRFTVLLVEDNLELLNLTREALSTWFRVIRAGNGKEALEILTRQSVDVIVSDVMMPEMDGWRVCREIRRVSNIPIIMLTAKGETFDKVLGLELGADDYMVKPFEPKELLARVKAVLRRSDTKESNAEKEIVFPNLTINLSNYELKINGNIVEVPPKELELLYFLASNPNRVFTREQLLEEVWGFDYFGDSRTVDVHIKRLREKLEGVEANWQLKTVWGVGYKFEVR